MAFQTVVDAYDSTSSIFTNKSVTNYSLVEAMTNLPRFNKEYEVSLSSAISSSKGLCNPC